MFGKCLPLYVFAMIAVGRSVTEEASKNALHSSSTSWPSTTIALNPNASNRFRYTSIWCWSEVGSDWPSRFTSKMTHRLLSL
uniref:Putative secreted protein n=1 Tax=Anopheles triannulatus TaxID=58253 RepID=A0A2M4B194_9DIPT